MIITKKKKGGGKVTNRKIVGGNLKASLLHQDQAAWAYRNVDPTVSLIGGIEEQH